MIITAMDICLLFLGSIISAGLLDYQRLYFATLLICFKVQPFKFGGPLEPLVAARYYTGQNQRAPHFLPSAHPGLQA
jgi:hypothetical protein